MGSVSLVCPMCCGETFDNSQSLKYHLLSMTDNLYCPNCSERSDSVAALIQHLDCCGESMEAANGLSEIDETEVSVDTKEDGPNHNYLATVNEDGRVVVGHLQAMDDPDEHIIDKMDIDDNADDNDDILEHLDEIGDIDIPKSEVEEEIEEVELRDERIKDENSSSETIDNETELIESESNGEITNFGGIDPLEEPADEEVAEEEQDETELVQVKQEICEVETEALYSCSSCSMSFNSVLSHIKEYHDGQEVVLEMAEQQMEDLPEEPHDFEAMVDDDQATNSSHEMKESSSIGERASVGSGTSGGVGLPRQRQTMNTLRTEECVDSEGRLYTRKVVQIERFWDRGSAAATGAQSQLQQQQHQQATKSSPMIEKFFSNAEGLKIRAKSPGIPVTNSTIVGVVTSPTSTTTMSNNTTNAVENCNDNSARHQLRMYRCNKCLEQFVKLAEFRVHACIHGNNRCDLCDQAFASAKALQLHSRIHEVETEGGSDNNFVCQTCGTEFTSHKSLRLHSRMHAPVRARHVDAPEGTSNEIFTCLECGKTLSESYRKAHMALHKGDSVTCTVCNRKFDSADSLAMHAAVHLEFGNSQNHKFHQSTEDRKDDESNRDGLRSAKGKKNDKSGGGDAQEKPYQCQHCGRRFTRPHEKVKHERIHTGEKPHACESKVVMDPSAVCTICDKALKSGTSQIDNVGQKGLRSLIAKSQELGDKKWKLWNNNSQLILHNGCRKWYLSASIKSAAARAARLNSSLTSSAATPGDTSSNLSKSAPKRDEFNFREFCLLCGKPWDRRHKPGYFVQHDYMKERLLERAQNRGDSMAFDVIGRLKGVDSLVAAGARYHKKCRELFAQIPSDRSASILKAAQIDSAFQLIKEHIIASKKGKFTVTELRQIMGNKCFSTKVLYRKLMHFFGDDIHILHQRGSRTLILYKCFSATMLCGNWKLMKMRTKRK